MGPELTAKLIEAATAAVAAHAEELTALDQAIGDGDHGLNMKRGFDAIAETGDEVAALPFDQALQKLGMTLVMKVGGASGPLYGSLLMAMGEAAGGAPADAADVANALAAGVNAVKTRGKSDVGEKTMLDVLVPTLETLRAASADGSTASEVLSAVRSAAAQGVEATKPMRALKGRASFLGERSIGHIDPGARSSALLIAAVCDIVEGELGA